MSSDQQYPYGQQQPYPEQPYQQYQDAYQQPVHDPGATQTWQAETWDTQYQPIVQPARPAADAAYLPPQGAYPLPP
ncbi:hypothetical protein HRW15_35930, partial [Streptomyces lunaelactis]|nr:hypothetical protein [Streptomyces lunaelactis]